jgi:hypothetical protein
MSFVLPKKLLLEVFGFGTAKPETDPLVAATRGTQKLSGFAYGTMMRKADAKGMPTGTPIEIRRGKFTRNWGENDQDFHDRLHVLFQKPMEHNENFTYTPHVGSLDDYLSMRAGRPFAHATHTDPATKEKVFFSHHLYPIYRDW